MIRTTNFKLEKMIYCICPFCKNSRKKVNGKFSIIKKGKERNGSARFFCVTCKLWFNEKTGDVLRWDKY